MTVRFLSFPVLHSSLVSLSKNAALPEGRAQKTSGGRHSGFPSQGPLSFCGCKGTAILRTVQVFSQKSCKIFFTRHSLAREHIIYYSHSQPPRGEAWNQGLGPYTWQRLPMYIWQRLLMRTWQSVPLLALPLQFLCKVFLHLPLVHPHKLLTLQSKQHLFNKHI